MNSASTERSASQPARALPVIGNRQGAGKARRPLTPITGDVELRLVPEVMMSRGIAAEIDEGAEGCRVEQRHDPGVWNHHHYSPGSRPPPSRTCSAKEKKGSAGHQLDSQTYSHTVRPARFTIRAAGLHDPRTTAPCR